MDTQLGLLLVVLGIGCLTGGSVSEKQPNPGKRRMDQWSGQP